MNLRPLLTAALAAISMTTAITASTSDADARARRSHHYAARYHGVPQRTFANVFAPVTFGNDGIVVFAHAAPTRQARADRAVRQVGLWQAAPVGPRHHYSHGGRARPVSEATYIPNPSGCRRTNLSCACRLAAYWGLGRGLDATETWPHRFARASGPGPRVAVLYPGHIMGIDGGVPGAWRIVNFNSGHHLNRSYTVSGFPPGTHFLDTTSRRTASR